MTFDNLTSIFKIIRWKEFESLFAFKHCGLKNVKSQA